MFEMQLKWSNIFCGNKFKRKWRSVSNFLQHMEVVLKCEIIGRTAIHGRYIILRSTFAVGLICSRLPLQYLHLQFQVLDFFLLNTYSRVRRTHAVAWNTITYASSIRLKRAHWRIWRYEQVLLRDKWHCCFLNTNMFPFEFFLKSLFILNNFSRAFWIIIILTTIYARSARWLVITIGKTFMNKNIFIG